MQNEYKRRLNRKNQTRFIKNCHFFGIAPESLGLAALVSQMTFKRSQRQRQLSSDGLGTCSLEARDLQAFQARFPDAFAGFLK